MAELPEEVKRRMIKDDLTGDFMATLEQRIDRYLEISPHGIIPNHHFAAASAECIRLYTDGHVLSAIMVTQAVAEGIRDFVVERNRLTPGEKMDGPAIVALLVERSIISAGCAEAFNRIWRSFRNDIHHMNPKVAQIPCDELAKRNIRDLTTIEREIFAFRIGKNGYVIPVDPKYWDVDADGTIPVFLRFSP